MKPKRSLVTILFTDIVGSTKRVAELRDAGWRDVRHEHNRRVRRELRRFGGHEINTAGDSFLATFASPARAIACAGAIRSAVRDMGLEVRAGLHMGELEQEGHDLGGLGVHIGARVAAEAGAGEILVSRSVHDALAGSPFDFEDRGVRALKGVPGEWRLFSVSAMPEAGSEALPWWSGRMPFTWRQAAFGGAGVALVLLVGLYLARPDSHPVLTTEEDLAHSAAPGIAVLPFTIQGEGLEVMREAMVSLLSTGLDGAGGLRTISPATVFARWREQVPGEDMPELPTALEIARRTGARYALLGSAVSLGSTMRVVATVYDVNTEEQLGQGQVEGSLDNVLPLVDRLGVDVLRIILQRGEEELPQIDLANLTTESPEALKAYLEGELHLRHFDIEAAQDAYTRAVDADSMFALAHTRLSQAYWWAPQNLTLARRHLARAAQLTDRLPAREALLVRARRAIWWRIVDELGALREGVQTYPDDAEMWYLLGETLLHLSGAMAPAEQVEAAFESAVQLDPGNAEYLYHYTQFAWTVHADSQEAVRRVEMFERAGSDRSAQSRAFRLALDLGFGDSAGQASAMARLATEDYDMVSEVGVTLLHPRYGQNLAVARMRFQRADDSEVDEATVRFAFTTLSYYGRFRELLDLLEDPRIDPGQRTFLLYATRTLGFPVLVESLDESMGSIAIDSIAEPWVIVNVGLYAADQGRWSDHQRVIAELERRRTLALVQGDSLVAWDSNVLADFVQGYGLWRRNGPEVALPILAAPLQQENSWWWLGQLYQKLGSVLI